MTRIITTVLVALACIALVVPAALMAAGVLPYKLYIVHTGSMSPTIPSNSVVLVRKGVYMIGQVITFETREGPVTHRLVDRKSDGTLVTKGDANATVDPGTVSPANVIGGVVAAPPLIGYVLVYLRNPLGLASALLGILVVWLLFSTEATLVARREQVRG